MAQKLETVHEEGVDPYVPVKGVDPYVPVEWLDPSVPVEGVECGS